VGATSLSTGICEVMCQDTACSETTRKVIEMPNLHGATGISFHKIEEIIIHPK